MKQDTIIKKDKDRKTELNRIVVNIPSDLKELSEWKLTGTESEMEKYIQGRIFQDWEKGMNVSVQSKLDNRKKGLDEGTKKIVDSYKIAPQNIKDITDKILRGESLTKEEMTFLTKKQMTAAGFGK